MAEFTKEQLIAAACSRIDFAKQMLRGNPSGLTRRNWEIELSLSEIALAALTADASMYASEETLICAEQGEFLLRTLNRPAGDATIPLYRLPLLEGLK